MVEPRSLLVSVWLLVATTLAGCITIKTVAIGEKTALERQLIGTFEPLSESEILVSSVRSAAIQHSRQTMADPNADLTWRRTLAARRRQLFNLDELDEFRAAGCIGEALGARVVTRQWASLPALPPDRIAAVISEENKDRDALVAWFVSAGGPLAHASVQKARRIYRELILDHAPDGCPVQTDERTWQEY